MAKYWVKATLEWEDEIEADSLDEAQEKAIEIADREGTWYTDGEEIIEDEEED